MGVSQPKCTLFCCCFSVIHIESRSFSNKCVFLIFPLVIIFISHSTTIGGSGDGCFSSYSFTFGQSTNLHFCCYSRDDPIKALEVISEVGDLLGIKYFPASPTRSSWKKSESSWNKSSFSPVYFSKGGSD